MFGLAQPWFMLAGLAVAIPITLHLMRREVVRDIVFPSIRFILKGRVPQGGRRRLQDLFLLLLRVLAILLLALLLAAPFKRLPPPASPNATGLNVALLDVSASMAAEGVFEEARERLRKAISAGGEWHLILSANGIVGESPPAEGTPALLGRLSRAPPGTAAGNHVDALRRAAELLAEAGGGVLHIVSDLHVASWTPEMVPRLPENTRLDFLKVGDDSRQNVGLRQARVEAASGEGVRVLAEVHNYAGEDQMRTATLEAGGEPLRREVAVPAGQTIQVVFQLDERQSDVGVLRLDGDAYVLDDVYHIWLGPPEPVRILAVLPPGVAASASELYFLRSALSVTAEGSRLVYDLQVAGSETFFALDLSAIDGLFLLGCAAYFDEPAFMQVRRFLEGGGVAVCTAADEAPARQLIGLQRSGLLAARFREVFADGELHGKNEAIGWVEPDSRIGRLFADVRDSDLFLFPIRRMLTIETLPPARDILRTESGYPFLVRQTVGDGVFFFLTAALVNRWSDLPVSMAFLPLVREMLAYAPATRDRDVLRLACGAGVPARRGLTGRRLYDADEPSGWSNSAYDASPRAGLLGETPVEINVSRRESLVGSRPMSTLREALTGVRTLATPRAVESDRRRDIRPLVALALMLVIVGEAAFAASRDAGERKRTGAQPPSSALRAE